MKKTTKSFDKEKQAELEKKLIKSIHRYIDTTKTYNEKYFAFSLANGEVLKYIRKLEEIGGFVDWYTDRNMKKELKKDRKQDGVESKMNIMKIEPKYGDISVEAMICGSYLSYCEAIIKKKIRKYTNESKLMYLKLIKDGELMYELGSTSVNGENIENFPDLKQKESENEVLLPQE